MKNLATIFNFEFKKTVKSKSFIVMSVIFTLFFLLLAGGVLIFGFVSGSESADEAFAEDYSEEYSYAEDYSAEDYSAEENSAEVNHYEYFKLYTIAVQDRSGTGLGAKLIDALPQYDIIFNNNLDEELCKQLIENEEVDAALIILSPLEFELYEPDALYSSTPFYDDVWFALNDLEQLRLLALSGVEGDSAYEIIETYVSGNVTYVGDNVAVKYVLGFFIMIMLFMCITLYGQTVAVRVATEKGNRTMEMLITSAKPSDLLIGKVLGVGAAGVLQIVLFAAACVSVVLVGVNAFTAGAAAQLLAAFSALSVVDVAVMILYFMFGFALAAFIFGSLGSMVSQIEDLSTLSSLPQFVFMIGYIIAVFSMSIGQPNIVTTVTSFVPFWSPMIMITRMTMESVPFVQLAVSLGLQIAATVFMAWAGVKIYRRGTLMYGNTPKFSDVFKLLGK
jgi:ABC-2 type transport system permease protein